jgi:hypothetical protein
MKGRWREEYQQREWMTRVDNSLLYQMENEAGRLQTLALEMSNSRLQEDADRFTYLLAVATGKTSQINLAAAEMPEDQTAKIPDPRDRHIELPERTR